MIYTVTFNPSIDYIVNVDNFMTGVVNRTSKEIIFPGGKGINVSMVLKNLGQESTALGFMAGFTGDAIIRLLQEKGVTADFIHVTEGLSRINVKLRAQTETEINGQDQRLHQKISGSFTENWMHCRMAIHWYLPEASRTQCRNPCIWISWSICRTRNSIL